MISSPHPRMCICLSKLRLMQKVFNVHYNIKNTPHHWNFFFSLFLGRSSIITKTSDKSFLMNWMIDTTKQLITLVFNMNDFRYTHFFRFPQTWTETACPRAFLSHVWFVYEVIAENLNIS